MFTALKKLFSKGVPSHYVDLVSEINTQETRVHEFANDVLRAESDALRNEIKDGLALDAALPRAFAFVREAAQRTLGQRHFDVQLMGGIAIHEGSVAEMSTGEGKTLAATAPIYLNALAGNGVHVVTVNEYLARRDAVWMGQIYRTLGLSVACLVPNAAYLYDPEWKIPEEGQVLIDKERDTTGAFLVQQEFLRPITRREAYLADITYGTNHEFGFDYLRDNLAYRLEEKVQRGHPFAVIDEVDSILIDEARTPLIISAPDAQSSDFYKVFARVVGHLERERDYTVDEKLRSVAITEEGIERVEKVMGIKNIYAPENLRLVHYLEESLRAKALYERDRNYVVKDGEVVIVDEFTGRLLRGRRYNGGLHQAIEAKEGVEVQQESRTYGKISIQNYFRMYQKIAGMTGTAQTSAEEFHKVYGLEVVSIPPNRPLARIDMPDTIYKNWNAKLDAIVHDVKERHAKGQPVLLGTVSIEKNELLSAKLGNAGIPHEVLNAKQNEREGAIIAQAGRKGGVTVATNIAGRGVDIILGGNPPDQKEMEEVRAAGGLHMIGTERHEARRIDNQLRGRAGRQGDPGSSQFYLSLEDDLLRIFGGDRIKSMMERFNLPDDQPIEVGMVSKAVAQAQSRVEGGNFDLRKHLLEYDDVLNKQRGNVYGRRDEILAAMNKDDVAEMVREAVQIHVDAIEKQAELFAQSPESNPEAPADLFKKICEESGVVNKDHPMPEDRSPESIAEFLKKRSEDVSGDQSTRQKLVAILDMLWMGHLEDLEALSESVGIRAYGQKDPLVEYRGESSKLFKNFWNNWNAWVFMNVFKAAPTGNTQQATHQHAHSAQVTGDKVGRNDPCPCGSGKKYKKCHGK